MLPNYEILVKTDYGFKPLPIEYYPNGEPLIRWPSWLVHVVQNLPEVRMLVRPKSLTSFLASLFFVDAIRERYGNKKIYSLILPLVPGSRQDRMNNTGDFLFTSKSVAREINARNFGQVTVVDPHSNVTPALIDRCKVVKPVDLVVDILMHVLGHDYCGYVISPDAGAEVRAGEVARALKVPLLLGSKKRDVETGGLSGFRLQLDQPVNTMRNIHCLVVDDLCDGGGTFVGLAKCIEDGGLTADLYTTHGLYTKGVKDLQKCYRRLITTDSVVDVPEGVYVVNACETLLNEPWIGG